jgi:hypothetical protein
MLVILPHRLPPDDLRAAEDPRAAQRPAGGTEAWSMTDLPEKVANFQDIDYLTFTEPGNIPLAGNGRETRPC